MTQVVLAPQVAPNAPNANAPTQIPQTAAPQLEALQLEMPQLQIPTLESTATPQLGAANHNHEEIPALVRHNVVRRIASKLNWFPRD
jgi:hypothetical protein